MSKKDTFYFSHDYNARNDEKILEIRMLHGAAGYGLFWMMVENMAENTNGGIKASLIGGLSLGYGVTKDTLLGFIKDCIEIGLFYEQDGYYFSKRLLTHKDWRVSLSEKGKEGALKRWGGYSHPNAKERKGKEKKENIYTFKLQGIYEKEWNEYSKILNGQADKLNESKFLYWKEFVDFVRDNDFTDLFNARFVSPIEFDKLVNDGFCKDKWDTVIKKILSTGIKPEHNLYFRIPEFLKYSEKIGIADKTLSDYEKKIISDREKYKGKK